MITNVQWFSEDEKRIAGNKIFKKLLYFSALGNSTHKKCVVLYGYSY